MRHGKKVKKLGRTAAHRKATLQALSTALISHKRITTTFVKAKALRSFVEPLINRAKEDTTHNRRQAFRRLQDKRAVTELFTEVADQIGDRAGGYTRVIKLGRRGGDAAEMAIIELVDYNDVRPESGGSSRKRKTRRSRSRGKKKPAATPQVAAAPVDTPATDAPAAEADDLTRIYGIGPKFAEKLNDNGVTTFASLAEMELEQLRALIADAGINQELANEESWVRQAEFAAASNWDAFESYVQELKDERKSD